MKPMNPMAGAKAMFMGGRPAKEPMLNGDESAYDHDAPPMPDEEMGMEPGEPAYDVLSEAAKRVFEQYLQAGQVPDPDELTEEGLSPREAEDVVELLEDTLGGM
jgi:hypothetical protein